MTTIIYNGVILRDCETKSFEQTIEYDDSGTDLLLSRFRIRVASVLTAISNTTVTPFGVDTPLGATAVQRMNDIANRLKEPRQDFWMLVDSGVSNEQSGNMAIDGVLLSAAGNPDGEMATHPLSPQFVGQTTARLSVIDVDNGPKPKSVVVTEIIGGRSMRVEFEIEICRKMCVPGFSDIAPYAFGPVASTEGKVLSNRWYLDESKDENWITTRVMQGTLRVAHKSFWPQLLRAVCVPPLLAGYKRTHQSFVDDPTGLVLKYRISDQQAHAAPPWPAIAWQAHHAESASGPNGSVLTGEISVRLVGPPGVDKVQLIGAAGKIAVDRIRGLVPTIVQEEVLDGSGNPTGQFETVRVEFHTVINNASIVNILHEPAIELRVQARYTTKDQNRSLAIRIQEMGKPLTTLNPSDNENNPYASIEGYNPRAWPVPLAYDSKTPAGTFACYLQNPCSVWHAMPGGLAPEVVPEPPRPPVNESGYPDADHYPSEHELPLDSHKLKGEASGDSIYDFPYQFVDLENHYVTRTGWSQLPYADTSPSAAETALLVQLHGRIAKRVLTMTATRDGKMPMIPSLVEDITDPNGIREVLEESEITVKAPELLADGAGRRYSVQVQYTYLMSRAPKITEKLRGSSSQLDKVLPHKNWLDLSTSQTAAMQEPSAP